MAGQRLGDGLRDTGADEVPHGRAPKVVGNATRTTGQSARGLPPLAERRDLDVALAELKQVFVACGPA
jgi:hypothetical protein